MNVRNLNQNRQLYVADAYSAKVDDTSAIGTIGSIHVGTANPIDKELYFLYKGVDGIQKSDRIQLKNLDYVKAFAPADMAEKMRKVLVTLDSNVNGGNPVQGQDYILRIAFRQFYGMSDEDQYFKDAAVHATAAMAANPSLFYQKMVDSLNLAFSREVGATKTSNPYLKFSVNNGIEIEELPQDWTLGTQSQERVYFEVIPTTVYFQSEDVVWAAQDATTGKYYAEQPSTTTVANGKKIADLEYFLMGERGDQYRMNGWPNHIPTQYLVDPTQDYYVLEIHHAFTDTGVDSYRSEKDITIVSTDKAVINSVIGDINSEASLSVDTLQ